MEQTSAHSGLIATMAAAIVSSRDFCGNEREAAIDAAYDEAGRKPTADELAQAFRAANGEWSKWQRAAGVTKPISHGERAAISRALEAE